MGYYNVIALFFVIGIVWGIKLMSSPKTAVRGNALGASCMLGAIILTLVSNGIVSHYLLWVSMVIGGLIGYVLAVKVTMIQMPQMVALLNGLGGGASAIVSLVVLLNGCQTASLDSFNRFTAGLALAVGGVTLSGSLIAAAKLDRRMKQQPTVLNGHSVLSILTLAVLGVLIILITNASASMVALFSVLTLVVALSFGVLFTIRVGGADMPVTISLLNSLSGVAGSIAGFAIYNPLLVAVGAVVGASGLILTQIMCRSMNRNILEVLTGKTAARTRRNTETIQQKEAALQVVRAAQEQAAATEENKKNCLYSLLAEAKKVVIVPGYGMALGQAQSQVKRLYDKLEEQGKEVKFAIHPVAGRMPGHMNVLLAEVDIPYEKLCELDEINPEFEETDVVIVVGANDVVNPAAITAEDTPIYGMPILRVDEAKYVIIFNRDTKPGYAGVVNPLYERENASLVLGDAADTVKEVVERLAAKVEDNEPKSQEDSYLRCLQEAKKVVIVPGYGMALGQAQSQVKRLYDKLEEQGKEVKFAIHPVAGRMPGHMNVLLAEVDIPYDKLCELDEINPEFEETDVVIVVGANDVVNPAAITAEDTPIYGMPILRVDEAKHVIIFNRDTKPGYAGVVNPLYERENASLVLGDAAQTLAEFLEHISVDK